MATGARLHDMQDDISTSAEAAENAALPRLHEVHADPGRQAQTAADLPRALQSPAEGKSPARWAYERLVLYIRNFEAGLDAEQEVAVGFAGGEAGVLRIEGLGYFDPDIVTFYGTDPSGAKTQLIQHVARLSVTLRALPRHVGRDDPVRIGFRLARDLDGADDATPEPAPGS